MAPIELSASAPVVVSGHSGRAEQGLTFWCDGTMGIVRRPASTIAISPNGPNLARHELTAGGFATGLLSADQPIQELKGHWDHASGGPLLVDHEAHQLVLIYHGETFADGDPQRYRSFIGMAVSTDDGRTFQDVGPVLTVARPVTGPGGSQPVELGSGSPVIHEGYVYLYFQDRSIREIYKNLCVARAPLAAVFGATRRRQSPVFLKFHEGSFTSPGLDGEADDLMPSRMPPVLWSDTAYVSHRRCFMVVYATVTCVVDGDAHWMHMASFSTDGVTWGPPTPLYDEPVLAEILYVTIDSGGSDQRTIEGPGFDLYRLWSDRSWRWDNARLERVRITFGE